MNIFFYIYLQGKGRTSSCTSATLYVVDGQESTRTLLPAVGIQVEDEVHDEGRHRSCCRSLQVTEDMDLHILDMTLFLLIKCTHDHESKH